MTAQNSIQQAPAPKKPGFMSTIYYTLRANGPTTEKSLLLATQIPRAKCKKALDNGVTRGFFVKDAAAGRYAVAPRSTYEAKQSAVRKYERKRYHRTPQKPPEAPQNKRGKAFSAQAALEKRLAKKYGYTPMEMRRVMANYYEINVYRRAAKTKIVIQKRPWWRFWE